MPAHTNLINPEHNLSKGILVEWPVCVQRVHDETNQHQSLLLALMSERRTGQAAEITLVVMKMNESLQKKTFFCVLFC